MLPHVQLRLVTDKSFLVDGVSAPLLISNVEMSQEHAVSSGPQFFTRLLDRFIRLKKTTEGTQRIQQLICGYSNPKEFITKINTTLKLNIEENETNFSNLEV